MPCFVLSGFVCNPVLIGIIYWYLTCRYFCACARCAHNHINCACTPTTTSIFSENIMCVTEMSPEAKQICCTNASHRRVWPHLWTAKICMYVNVCVYIYIMHMTIYPYYAYESLATCLLDLAAREWRKRLTCHREGRQHVRRWQRAAPVRPKEF